MHERDSSHQEDTTHMKAPHYPDVITPRSFPQVLQDVKYDPFGLMPRRLAPHPRILVGAEQVTRARALIRSCKWAACALARLEAHCGEVDDLPAELPVPAQPQLNVSAADVAVRNALAFLLTRQKAYRQRGLKYLRLLAHGCPHWPVKPGGNQITSYCLGESRMHLRLAQAYDLLASDGLSEEDNRLFRDMLSQCRGAADACPHYTCGNINTWSQTGRLALGLALADRGAIHDVLYGCERTGQWRYGLIHMLRHDVLSDGVHWERTPGYHFYTLSALTQAAEMLLNNGSNLWHVELPSLMQDDGHDLHRAYGPKGRKSLKAAFDAPFYQTSPSGDFSLVHDSGLANLRGVWTWGILYNLAYQAYGDPKYAWLLNRMEMEHPAGKRAYTGLPMPLNTTTGDIDFVRLRHATYPKGTFTRANSCSLSLAGRHEPGADLFPVQGSAVLSSRPDDTQAVSAYLGWAPHSAGHMSPAALHLDIWGGGRRVTDAPRAAGYKDPNYLTWVRTTIAHNTVTVDEMPMFPYDFETESINETDRWRDTISDGILELFQPDGPGFKAVRASNDNVYRGVRLDRTVVVTDRYVLDVYRVLSAKPHQYDWAMHGVGRMRLPAGATAIDLGAKRGYRHIVGARCLPTREGPVRLAWRTPGTVSRVCILPPKGARVIAGHDPVSPDPRLGELDPVGPRQVAIVRARGRTALFLSLWAFGAARESSLSWMGGRADGEVILETHVEGESSRWVFPFAPEPVRRETCSE
jgi:hypothetical protein